MLGHNSNVSRPPHLTLSEVPARARYTPAPADNGTRRCRQCFEALPAGTLARARYCSSPCRQAAYRRRAAGLPELEAPALSVGPTPYVDDGAQNRKSLRTRSPRPTVAARLSVVSTDHDHSPRLCAHCTQERYLEIRPAPRARVSAELVAARIRRAHGNVWPAVVAFGISYRHALTIRAGWRGDRRRVEPLHYRSRGWQSGRRPGWSHRLEALRES